MIARRILGGIALAALLITGCDDKTIDKAAEGTKDAVDAAARASKQASEASGKLLDDAKSGTKELIEKIPDSK